jgi:ubiquinone/menaquinone biosynthesis C-methylase UbiE
MVPWAHGLPEAMPSPTLNQVDVHEAGLMNEFDTIRQSFDAVAQAYANEFADELARKPFDRRLLDRFARALPRGSVALDLGCGSAGQIGRFLADRGLSVIGIDLSPRSIEVARARNPHLSFRVADMRALPFADGSIDAIVAFYSLIYGTDDDVEAGLAEARRVVRPAGRILVAVHGALDDRESEETFTEFHEIPIDIRMRYTTPARFVRLAENAGLRIKELQVRDPYEFEHQSRRIYLVATRPDDELNAHSVR